MSSATPFDDSTRDDGRRSSPLILAALALIGVVVLNLAAPFVPVPSALVAGILAVALVPIYVALVVLFALGVARAKLSIPATLVAFVAFIGLWLLVEFALRPLIFAELRPLLEAKQRPSSIHVLLIHLIGIGRIAGVLQTIALIGGATLFGAFVSRLIRYPSLIGPIGGAVALIDIWGVLFGGIVSQLLTNPATAPISERALAQGPSVGSIGASAPEFAVSLPSIGMGDFLFFGLFLTALARFEMNTRASAWLMGAFVTLALWLIILPTGVPAVPGLLPIGLGAILPNLRYFKFTREEKFALLWAGVLVGILTVALFFGFRAALPDAPPAPTEAATSR